MTNFKCNLCEEIYSDLDIEEIDNIDSIRETGRCVGCYEEYGDEAPDRI